MVYLGALPGGVEERKSKKNLFLSAPHPPARPIEKGEMQNQMRSTRDLDMRANQPLEELSNYQGDTQTPTSNHLTTPLAY